MAQGLMILDMVALSEDLLSVSRSSGSFPRMHLSPLRDMAEDSSIWLKGVGLLVPLGTKV